MKHILNITKTNKKKQTKENESCLDKKFNSSYEANITGCVKNPLSVGKSEKASSWSQYWPRHNKFFYYYLYCYA